VIIGQPVIYPTKRKGKRERQRSREGRVSTLESGETADLRQIRASDGERLRPLLRLFSLLFTAHILLVEVLFRAFLRGIGLVGDTDETVNVLGSEFIGDSVLRSSTVLTPNSNESNSLRR
jgi:hypothetical protein